MNKSCMNDCTFILMYVSMGGCSPSPCFPLELFVDKRLGEWQYDCIKRAFEENCVFE